MNWPADTEKFRESLAHLLPPGFAFPRDPNSNVQRVMRALAAILAAAKEFADDTIKHSIPANLCCDESIAEWERTVGLPDECQGVLDDCEQRISAVLLRLANPELHYNDSSTASIGTLSFLTAMARAAGFEVQIKARRLFRFIRESFNDRFGQSLGVLDIYVGGIECERICEPILFGERHFEREFKNCFTDITTSNEQITCEPIRFGKPVFAERFLNCKSKFLECLFDRIAPARFELNFIYCGEHNA